MHGDGHFWVGVVAGLGGLWVYHKFVKPIPTSAGG